MQATVKQDDEPRDDAGAGPRGVDGELLTPLELAAWHGMLRTHAVLVRRLDDDLRARHGLSVTSYEALMLLGTSPRRRMRISELSGATLLSVSGMSRMVDRLVREGLVVREACEEDGRGAEVALTPSGRRRLRAARAGHLAGVRREFLSRFSDDELAAMGAFWSRIPPDD